MCRDRNESENGRLKNQKNSSAHKLCDRGELAWLINRKQIIRKRNLGTSVLKKILNDAQGDANPSYQGNKRFWNLTAGRISQRDDLWRAHDRRSRRCKTSATK